MLRFWWSNSGIILLHLFLLVLSWRMNCNLLWWIAPCVLVSSAGCLNFCLLFLSHRSWFLGYGWSYDVLKLEVLNHWGRPWARDLLLVVSSQMDWKCSYLGHLFLGSFNIHWIDIAGIANNFLLLVLLDDYFNFWVVSILTCLMTSGVYHSLSSQLSIRGRAKSFLLNANELSLPISPWLSW